MSIEKQEFTNEDELHSWVEENIKTFLGDVLFVPGNYFISTKRNKGGKPDGFVLDIHNSSWSIIETELLRHGVWDHIAEQVMRFIVAAQSEATKRKIRDIFFDAIESENLIEQYSDQLKINPHRLTQKIENIIEGQSPEIVIFIDDVNEDLEDMVAALNATVRVFKIQKYKVNGATEYLSPEGQKTAIETTIEDVANARNARIGTAEALELLGGGKFVANSGNLRFYELESGDKVSIKYSKFYTIDNTYWYGVTPNTLEKYSSNSLSHIVFILGSDGVVKVPIDVLREYLKHTGKSHDANGDVRHYHVLIKNDPKLVLWVNQDTNAWELEEYFYVLES